jgi:hypothetical protein
MEGDQSDKKTGSLAAPQKDTMCLNLENELGADLNIATLIIRS